MKSTQAGYGILDTRKFDIIRENKASELDRKNVQRLCTITEGLVNSGLNGLQVTSPEIKQVLFAEYRAQTRMSTSSIIYDQEELDRLPDTFYKRMEVIQGKNKEYAEYAHTTGILGYRMSKNLLKYLDKLDFDIQPNCTDETERVRLMEKLGVTFGIFPCKKWDEPFGYDSSLFHPHVFSEAVSMALTYVLKEKE